MAGAGARTEEGTEGALVDVEDTLEGSGAAVEGPAGPGANENAGLAGRKLGNVNAFVGAAVVVAGVVFVFPAV